MRKTSKDVEVNRETVRIVAKKKPNIKAYKLRKSQELTEKKKKIRLERCKALLRSAALQNLESILVYGRKTLHYRAKTERQK